MKADYNSNHKQWLIRIIGSSFGPYEVAIVNKNSEERWTSGPYNSEKEAYDAGVEAANRLDR